MHTLKEQRRAWRMLPPAGAPLGPAALGAALRALLGQRGNTKVPSLSIGDNGNGEIWNREKNVLSAARQAFARYFAVPHVFFAGSGREALCLLFTALRPGADHKDEVLLPAYASYTLPAAVVRAGLRVALYDVEPLSLTPCLKSLRAALSRRTLAVVVCHLFGFPFDLAPLAGLCREAGAVLVDDAAQAMGATVDGVPAGSMGDVGLFSLGRGKCITAVQGGVLITRDTGLAERLRPVFATAVESKQRKGEGAHNAAIILNACAFALLRRPALYRLPASLPWLRLGESVFDPNFRHSLFGAAQAALALHALDGLERVNHERKTKAARYAASLNSVDNSLQLIVPAPGAEPVYTRFPLLPRRNSKTAGGLQSAAPGDKDGREGTSPTRRFASALMNLGVSPGFPLPIQDIPELRPHLARPDGHYPGAAFLARHLFTLPTHDHVRPGDISTILARALAAFAAKDRDGQARQQGGDL